MSVRKSLNLFSFLSVCGWKTEEKKTNKMTAHSKLDKVNTRCDPLQRKYTTLTINN